MLRLYGCIAQQHDLRLVLLAAVFCFFGCDTALTLLARASGEDRSRREIGWKWITAAAIVAGGSVWATHFVAMLAFRPGLPVGYDIPLTALSIVIAMAVSWIAFVLALRLSAPVIGGAVFGLAVCFMHFTGMEALDMPAQIQWDPVFVLCAIVVGVGFGALGLRAFTRRRGFASYLYDTALLTVAIAGLHFTGMASASIVPDPTVANSSGGLAPEWLGVTVATVMIVFVLGLSGSVVDQHLTERNVQRAARRQVPAPELETAEGAIATPITLSPIVRPPWRDRQNPEFERS